MTSHTMLCLQQNWPYANNVSFLEVSKAAFELGEGLEVNYVGRILHVTLWGEPLVPLNRIGLNLVFKHQQNDKSTPEMLSYFPPT